MEILYIYIHDYKKIQKQNINFGGKYRFHYDYESKELTVSENHQHIEGFYDKHPNQKGFAKITNVTSIIGENGVGKTTVLDFIYENFRKNSLITTSFIIALKVNQKIEVSYFALSIEHNNISFFKDVSLNNLRSIQKEPLNQDEIDDLFNDPIEFKKFSKTSIVLFSNIFDRREIQNIFVEPHNISTNYLINNDLYNLRNKSAFPARRDSVKNHTLLEVYRQANFLTKNILKIPFQKPRFIRFSLTRNLLNGSGNSNSTQRIRQKIQQGDIYYVLLDRIKRLTYRAPHNSELLAIDEICANSIISFFDEQLVIKLDDETISFGPEILSSIVSFLDNPNHSIKELIIYMRSMVDKKTRYLKENDNKFIQVLDGIFKFNDFLLYLHDQNKLFLDLRMKGGRKTYFLKIFLEKDNDYEELSSLFRLYQESFNETPYLNFDWHNLSSGEQALLSIYARFYSITDVENNKYKLGDNIIILMDEPDTNLHPQWQKTLLNSLLDFLPEIYGRKDADSKKIKQRNIQIIFTTNNPISASDMLASNTIFMKLDNDRSVQIQDSLTDQRQTFGANIYSLYADSFFIQDGLMGKFASEKINTIIKNLNSLKPLNAQERETMRKTILQIGEPAIKNKLIQMYSDRYNLDIHERLDKLENKLNKDDQDTPE
jgi:hypothetical protein